MYILLLGGYNDENGNLSNFTIDRLNKFFEIYDLNKNLNPKIIISGGYRFSKMSHCAIIKEYIVSKKNICFEKEFIENNDTIDEALNISNYFKNNRYIGKICIITSSWHMERVKYLFNKTFEKLINITIEYIESYDINDEYINDEKYKLEQLITKPYGKWLEYIKTN